MSGRRTKIVVTLGPATREPEAIGRLLEAGADVFRINCSHSTPDSLRSDIAHIRRKAAEMERAVAILLDLQGPKIRTGPIDPPLDLASGDLLQIHMDKREGSGKSCGTTYPQLASDLSVGDLVLFADGALSGTVEEIGTDRVDIRMQQGGRLGAHKGINLPGIHVSAPSMTDKDMEDLEVGVGSGVDYVALSFVRCAQDIRDIKEQLAALGRPKIPVIAKIEKPAAVEHIEEILEESDAIMVARGDLGVELPLESLPMHQKGLIRAANRAGVLVITATQMLDSMERNPRPTRAETTDVANAILDGTDAVMLSGETAVGSFPIESVLVMNRIAIETEQSAFFTRPGDEDLPPVSASGHSVARAACLSIAEYPRPLIVFTWSGHSALVASKYRPPGRILALTPSPTVCDRLALVWGVTPVLVDAVETTDDLINHGERVLLDGGYLKKGDQVVVLAGSSPMKGATNLMKIYRIGDE